MNSSVRFSARAASGHSIVIEIEFKSLFFVIKVGGSPSDIPFLGVTVGDGANVGGETKDFLNDDDSAFNCGASAGAGFIDGELRIREFFFGLG